MQVDPIKPMLKAPGTKRLKLIHGKLLSTFAFKSNLRRYTQENVKRRAPRPSMTQQTHGRAVQLDSMKPTLKPTGNERLKLKCDILLSKSAVKFNLRRYAAGAT